MRRLGIDEAGRGCVLGALVFGAVLIESTAEPRLRAAGARDSKLLSAPRRAAVERAIRGIALEVRLREIPAPVLDGASLNALGSAAILELIRELDPDEVVLDAPVAPGGIPGWVASLRRSLGDHRVRIVAENRADVNHPVCSAASVVAKVRRDALLAALEAQVGQPLGSGYPSDPTTRRWLLRRWAEHGAFPDFVRHKWQTVIDVMGTQQRLL